MKINRVQVSKLERELAIQVLGIFESVFKRIWHSLTSTTVELEFEIQGEPVNLANFFLLPFGRSLTFFH